MGENSLDRLNRMQIQSNPNMTLQEQMSAAENNNDDVNFINDMSQEAKDTLFDSLNAATVEPVEQIEEDADIMQEEENVEMVSPDGIDQSVLDTVYNDENDSVVEENTPLYDEPFNNNTEEKKSRGRPKKEVSSEKEDVSYNPIMDQLAKDLIDKMREDKVTIGRFSNSQMKLVFDYMYKKFN